VVSSRTFEDAQRLAKRLGATPITLNPCSQSDCYWSSEYVSNARLPKWWRGSGVTFAIDFEVKDSLVRNKGAWYEIGILNIDSNYVPVSFVSIGVQEKCFSMAGMTKLSCSPDKRDLPRPPGRSLGASELIDSLVSNNLSHLYKDVMPYSVSVALSCMTAAGIEDGRLLRAVSKSGKVNRDTLSDWSAVEQSSKQIGIEHFGAHDLRRTCAKLCRKGGETWSRSNSCWATLLYKPGSSILAPSKI
jgi:hypothetical protein